ncbi:hypothetical protein BHF71_08655 [Vulcanibacillus modesticaldus]|uniref:Uncharacterized protein n=1 Tax=Vulcanibacillus modesticaldus TaxID=337097 RepID=A0A1D2YV03_9BACI|nr:efflux RND transporter periplasmic adaptor subunit [Vulcanibacillus modesticaldus]OEF99542.1 hypothetical protein BHF71_08655 [Vulcanibacillus modesticaldus]
MKKKISIIFLGLVLLSAIIYININNIKETQSSANLIKITYPKKEVNENTVYALGKIEMKDTTELYSKLNGQIQQIAVKEGDEVEQNQVIATLDPTNMLRNRDQLEESLSELYLEQKKIGQSKQINELILKEANISLGEAESEYQKALDGFNGGWVTKEALEKAKKQLELADLQYKKAELQVKVEEDREIVSAKLLQLKIQNIKQQLEQLKKDLENAKITATNSGSVIRIFVKEGQYVNVGTSIALIGSLNELEVVGRVNEFDSAKIKEGDRVTIDGDAFTKEYKGKITYISPIAVDSLDGRETNIEIRVDFEDNIQGLKPGYNVYMTIEPANSNDVYLIPSSSLVSKDNKDYVYVLVDNQVVEKEIRIKSDQDSQEELEVTSGLREQDKIIVNPWENIKDGETINLEMVEEIGEDV